MHQTTKWTLQYIEVHKVPGTYAYLTAAFNLSSNSTTFMHDPVWHESSTLHRNCPCAYCWSSSFTSQQALTWSVTRLSCPSSRTLELAQHGQGLFLTWRERGPYQVTWMGSTWCPTKLSAWYSSILHLYHSLSEVISSHVFFIPLLFWWKFLSCLPLDTHVSAQMSGAYWCLLSMYGGITN